MSNNGNGTGEHSGNGTGEHSGSTDIKKYKPIGEMNESERRYFKKTQMGNYLPIDLLIELDNQPPCPSDVSQRVNTDFPNSCLTTLFIRIADEMGVEDMRIKRDSRGHLPGKSIGYLYNKDYYERLAPIIFTMVALKARRARASVNSDDFSEREIEHIISEAGLERAR